MRSSAVLSLRATAAFASSEGPGPETVEVARKVPAANDVKYQNILRAMAEGDGPFFRSKVAAMGHNPGAMTNHDIARMRSRERSARPGGIPADPGAAIVERFAELSGDTLAGAENMIRLDRRLGTYPFVRAEAFLGADDDAPGAVVHRARTTGHTPKPDGAKSLKSDRLTGFLPMPARPNYDRHAEILLRIDAGKCAIGGDLLLDMVAFHPSKVPNPGFGKPVVSDVDLCAVVGAATNSLAGDRTVETVMAGNGWDVDPRYSVMHGAIGHWRRETETLFAFREGVRTNHFADGRMQEACGATRRLGDVLVTNSALRKVLAANRERKVDFATATFKRIESDPIVAVVEGQICRTYLDRMQIDILRPRKILRSRRSGATEDRPSRRRRHASGLR